MRTNSKHTLQGKHLRDRDSVINNTCLFIRPVDWFPGSNEKHEQCFVLPYCKRELVTTKGSTASMWRLQVQKVLLSSALIAALSGREIEDDEFGTVSLQDREASSMSVKTINISVVL